MAEDEHTDHLAEDDDEYQQVRHYLTACLVNKGELGKVEVWKIKNPHLLIKYERKSKSLLKVISLSNLTSDKIIGAENKDVFKICNEGFDFRRDGGLEFTTGICTSVPPANPSSLTPESYTMIYSEVAIGRSVIVEEKMVTTHAMPLDYDSFYIPQKPLDRNDDGLFDYDEFQAAANFDDRDPIDYCHRYYIKDPSQVLPKYVIEFSFAHKALSSSRNGNLQADDQIGYFDPVLFKPVTYGEYRRSRGRQLLTLNEAYEQAKLDMKRPDVLVKGRKEWIEQQLAELDERCRQVNLNMATVHEDIEVIAERCQTELRALSREKFETLLGVEIELNRQKEQLAWMDEVIKRARAHAEMVLTERRDCHAEAQVEFLHTWRSHTLFRNSVSRMKAQEMNVLQKVVPNMALNAGDAVKVWLDPFWQDRGESEHSTGPEASQSDLWRTLHGGVAQGHYVVPPKPKHDLLVPTLQSIIDLESDRIQQALEMARKDGSIALPQSVLRSPAAGDKYMAPLSNMLTASNSSIVHPLNADPQQKFNAVMQYYTGKPSEKSRAVDMAAQFQTPLTDYHHHAQESMMDELLSPELHQEEETVLVNSAPQRVTAIGRTKLGAARTPAAAPADKASANIRSPQTPFGSTQGNSQLPVAVLEKVASRFSRDSLHRNAQLKKQRLANNKAAQIEFNNGVNSLTMSPILRSCHIEDAAEVCTLSFLRSRTLVKLPLLTSLPTEYLLHGALLQATAHMQVHL